MPPIVEAFLLYYYTHQKLFLASSAVTIIQCP